MRARVEKRSVLGWNKSIMLFFYPVKLWILLSLWLKKVIVYGVLSGGIFTKSSVLIHFVMNLIYFYNAGRIWLVTVVLHNVLHIFLHIQVTYMALWILVKKLLHWSLVLPLFCLYIQCGGGNSQLWVQYTIMDCRGLTNTVSLWVLNFQPHRFRGIQLDKFHSQTTVLCGIGQIIVSGGMKGRAYLG